MRRASLVLLSAIAASACARTPRPNLTLAAMYDEAYGCRVRIGEQIVPLKDADQMKRLIGTGHTAIRVIGGLGTPYNALAA